MECEHENSARCISPPLDDTVQYWSEPVLKPFWVVCDMCLRMADYEPPYFVECNVCRFTICHNCYYAMVGDSAGARARNRTDFLSVRGIGS